MRSTLKSSATPNWFWSHQRRVFQPDPIWWHLHPKRPKRRACRAREDNSTNRLRRLRVRRHVGFQDCSQSRQQVSKRDERRQGSMPKNLSDDRSSAKQMSACLTRLVLPFIDQARQPSRGGQSLFVGPSEQRASVLTIRGLPYGASRRPQCLSDRRTVFKGVEFFGSEPRRRPFVNNFNHNRL